MPSGGPSHLLSLCSVPYTPVPTLATVWHQPALLSPPMWHSKALKRRSRHWFTRSLQREVKARLCPPWVASCQPGPETPESGARLSPTAPCPHAHARGAGTPRFHAPGPVEALACGPGSEPLIRRWQLSREPFNVVRWYFSGFFSEGKS